MINFLCRGAWLSDHNSRKAIIIYNQISSRFTASVAFYRHFDLKPQKVKKKKDFVLMASKLTALGETCKIK